MEKFVLIWRLETEGQVYRDDASRDSLNTSRDIETKKKRKKKKRKEKSWYFIEREYER